MEEQLIEAVRGFPLIYNKSLREFRDKGKKAKAWKQVAAATGVEENLCQTRWRSLCDRYVKEAGEKPVSGSGSVGAKSTWKFMELLSFLGGHCSPRKTSSCSEMSPHLLDEEDGTPEYLDEILVSENEQEEEWNEPQPKKTKKVEAEDSFKELCGVVKELVVSQTKAPESRNAGFLQILDSYLIKLPENVQDKLKIKFMCEVQENIDKFEC